MGSISHLANKSNSVYEGEKLRGGGLGKQSFASDPAPLLVQAPPGLEGIAHVPQSHAHPFLERIGRREEVLLGEGPKSP